MKRLRFILMFFFTILFANTLFGNNEQKNPKYFFNGYQKQEILDTLPGSTFSKGSFMDYILFVPDDEDFVMGYCCDLLTKCIFDLVPSVMKSFINDPDFIKISDFEYFMIYKKSIVKYYIRPDYENGLLGVDVIIE